LSKCNANYTIIVNRSSAQSFERLISSLIAGPVTISYTTHEGFTLDERLMDVNELLLDKRSGAELAELYFQALLINRWHFFHTLEIEEENCFSIAIPRQNF